jgi:hypothetical protein
VLDRGDPAGQVRCVARSADSAPRTSQAAVRHVVHVRLTCSDTGVTRADQLVLRAAVSAYLGRYRGETRLHTESDLPFFPRWCTDHDVDPLTAVRWTSSGTCAGCRTCAATSPPPCRQSCRTRRLTYVRRPTSHRRPRSGFARRAYRCPRSTDVAQSERATGPRAGRACCRGGTGVPPSV